MGFKGNSYLYENTRGAKRSAERRQGGSESQGKKPRSPMEVGDDEFAGTHEELVSTMRSLPAKPDNNFSEQWRDVNDEYGNQHGSSVYYKNRQNGLFIRFDPAKPGAPALQGADHYHIYNPKRTGAKDQYLDEDGKPVRRGSRSSHIIRKEKES